MRSLRMPFLQRFELCVAVKVADYVQSVLFEFELSWCRHLNRATPRTMKFGVNLLHSFVTNSRSAACSNVFEILTRLQSKLHASGKSLISFELVEDSPGDVWRSFTFANTVNKSVSVERCDLFAHSILLPTLYERTSLCR